MNTVTKYVVVGELRGTTYYWAGRNWERDPRLAKLYAKRANAQNQASNMPSPRAVVKEVAVLFPD